MDKSNILITLVFKDHSPEPDKIKNEAIIKQQISTLMQKQLSAGLIKHFIMTDNVDVSYKLLHPDKKR